MAESLGDLLRRGWQLHHERRYAEAEAAYRRVLAAQPDHPAALYCFGRLALDVRNLNVAVDCLARAAAGDPQRAAYRADLAQALQALERYDEAIACYRRAIELEPSAADVHVNFGNTLLAAGRPQEAIAEYRCAIEHDPKLAEAHSCLGAALEQEGCGDEAIACYRRAIELRPGFAYAHFNLGTALRNTDRQREALEHLQAAVRLAPAFPPAHHNLGVLWRSLDELAAAQAAFEQAISLDNRQAVFHFNLGDVLERQGRVHEALASYEQALRLKPDYAEARCSRGTAHLKLGQFTSGWSDYESRVGREGFDTLSFPEPTWDGSPLGCRTLLVHCEQGMGDVLQFIRYVRVVEHSGGKVIVATRPSLIPLLEQSGFTNLVSKHEPLPQFDVQAPLLSLPGILATQLESVPREVPYLAADPDRVQRWREVLAPWTGLRVGIQWQGRKHPGMYRRAIRAVEFEPLARLEGVVLVSLQKDYGQEQQAEAQQKFPLHAIDSPFDEEGGAFMDTAAIIKNLDLVVTCDTALAHLAGALGAPVWVALPAVAEWRWLLDRDDSPWYPTMRLVRQTKLGDWSDVFGRMAQELNVMARHQSSP